MNHLDIYMEEVRQESYHKKNPIQQINVSDI